MNDNVENMLNDWDNGCESIQNDLENNYTKKKQTMNLISQVAENTYTLGYSGKNLFQEKGYTGGSYSNHIFTNSSVDTRTYFMLYVDYNMYNEDGSVMSNVSLVKQNITKVGRVSYKFTPTKDGVIVRVKHNGDTSGFYLASNLSIPVYKDKSYIVSMNVQGTNPSVVGGLVVSDIMIRDADIIDDTYEPYKDSVNNRLDYKLYTPKVAESMVGLGFGKDTNVSVSDFFKRLIKKHGNRGFIPIAWALNNSAFIGDKSNNFRLNGGFLIFYSSSNNFPNETWTQVSAIYIDLEDNTIYKITAKTDTVAGVVTSYIYKYDGTKLI